MKLRNLSALLVAGPLGLSLAARPAHADLLTYYNFNDINTTSDTPTGGPVPKQTTSITTNAGTGGLNSYSLGLVGSTQNALGTDPAGVSLGYLAGNTTQAAGAYFQFGVNMTGYKNVSISYAGSQANSQASSSTLSYSLDGNTFFNAATDNFTTNATYTTFSHDLSGVSSLNGVSNVIFRIGNFSSTANTSYFYDNFQVNAVATPEPSTYAMMAVGMAALAMFGKRRKRGENDSMIALTI